MQKVMLMKNENEQAEELAAMLDELFASGTQHVNLQSGEQTVIHTVNSTECSPKGACAIPNAEMDE